MKKQKLYISHRGNLHGPNSCLENTLDYITEAINCGFDVEIDVWLHKNKWYLGHDEPQVLTDLNFFKNFYDIQIPNYYRYICIVFIAFYSFTFQKFD